MSDKRVNQKEYLKKYLSGDVGQEKKKKKKKKEKPVGKATVTIVDDDFDIKKLAAAAEDEGDLDNYALGEDLPQIAGIIDERPPEVIAKESGKWKTFGENGSNSEQDRSTSSHKLKESTDLSPVRRNKRTPDASPRRHQKQSPDQSPPRRSKPNRSRSPLHKRRKSIDHSPPRRSRRDSHSPKHSKRSPDLSPVRRNKRSPDASPRRRRQKRSPDHSPSRRSRQSPDTSKLNRSKRYHDASPPRKPTDSNRKSRWESKYSPDLSPQRKRKSHDGSTPPRKINRSPDLSPVRRNKRTPDASPPRRQKRSPDQSPPRRSRSNRNRSPIRRKSIDHSPPRRLRRDSHSPKRNELRKSSDSPPPTHKKMMQTLDGKVAGLQNASALREENERFKKREDEVYKRMAAAHKRDDSHTARERKTGQRRKLHENVEQEREKAQKEEVRKQKYTRWGAGLKQIEEFKERITVESHEMSKPVARYADDKDLEDHLRSQTRDGDPMADYFRRKAKETKSGPSIPVYQGSYPENRFGIRPGYRWDGVDRSNGYEKKWFDVQSKKKAGEEEAYKYSVEDM